MVITFTRKIM